MNCVPIIEWNMVDGHIPYRWHVSRDNPGQIFYLESKNHAEIYL